MRKAVFLFVKRGHERLHPADAMELLLEVAKGDDGSKQPERMGKERCRLRRRAVALAGRLERNGRFDGDEEGRSMTLTLVRERETIAKIDYKNTPYTRFLIGCISSQANFLKGGAGIARPKARAYQVCCGPALESAIRKGTEGIPESLQGQLRRLGTMIGTGATVSALAAGFAIKIVADAMAGSYSLESTLAAAFFGALAFFYTFGIKSMHKQAREALKTLDVAKLMDILDRYKTAGHGEEGGCE